jgi:hypothetical protein
MKMESHFVDRDLRFALCRDLETGRTFVSIPVRNQRTEYEEWYEIDAETFAEWLSNPELAHSFVGQAKRRELDHLLLLAPGSDRGWPD